MTNKITQTKDKNYNVKNITEEEQKKKQKIKNLQNAEDNRKKAKEKRFIKCKRKYNKNQNKWLINKKAVWVEVKNNSNKPFFN